MIFRLSKKSFLCGNSVIGPSHIKNGIVNQDSFLLINHRKYKLAVVSDGMGSKKYAETGSKMACLSVKKEIARFVKNKDSALSMNQLFLNIIETWKKLILPHEPQDCSATCLFLFATKSKLLAARLGDGMICLIGKDAADSISMTDSKEENFSNATQALSDSRAAEEFCYSFYDRKNFKGFVISSDGISSDMETGKEMEFSAALFEELQNLHFWKRNRFIKKMMTEWPVPHHTDDKTLVAGGL